MADETINTELTLNAAQMLKTLGDVNAKAGSIPEVLKNVEMALEAFAEKFGLSFGAAEKEMKSVLVQAENLRAMLANPIAAPTVLMSPKAMSVAGASNPFGAANMSAEVGLKAMNDQRKAGLVLQKQEQASEAAVANEINEAKLAEERKLAAQKNVVRMQMEENELLAASARIREAENAQKATQQLAAAGATTSPAFNQPLSEEYRKSGDGLIKDNQQVMELMNNVGESAEKNSKLVVGGVDVMRRAVSFFIGQVLFQLLIAFQNVFKGAIDGAKSLETSFYNLVGAEKAMSEAGINVTFKDLTDVVDRLHAKFQGLFSNVELKNVVSQVAIATKELGLNASQIEKIAETAARIQLQNPDKSISDIATTLTTADLNGRTTALAKLGVNVDAIKQKEAELAAQLGVSTKDLTENQKATIFLEASYESATKGTDAFANSISDRRQSFSGILQTMGAAWRDFLAQLGSDFSPLISRVLSFFIEELQKAEIWLYKNRDAVVLFADVLGNVVVIFLKLAEIILKFGTMVAYSFAKAIEGAQKFIDKYPVLKKISELLGLGLKESAPDTPTTVGGTSSTPAPNNANLIKAEQKTQEELNKIAQENTDKRLDIETNYQQKREDIALNYSQKLEDIATQTAEKEADAKTDYANKIADIDRDTAKAETDAKTESRKKQLDAEKKYQDELKKLRQKFLMDLEDALQARDAKQVLHLIRQFDADKVNLADQKQQEENQAKQDLQTKLKNLEQESKLKKAQAQRDLNEKLKAIQLADQRERQQAAIANQRALNDAQIAYNRQLADQRLYLQRKLRDLAAAIQQEFNLTAAGMAAINRLIGSYATGATGTTSTTSAPSNTNTSTSSIGSPIGNASSPSSINGGLYTPPSGMAEGGSFLATRPRSIRIAENRPELITATPLGKTGADINKMFSDVNLGSNSSGNDGKIEISMTLSPDLEARITQNTLNEHAKVVAKINRSR